MEIAIRVFVYLIIINIVRSIISKKKSEDELADNVICLPNYSNLIKVCSLIILIIVAFISIIEKNVIENTGALIAGVILLIFAVLLYLFAVYIEYTRIVFDEEKIVERELFVGTKEFYYKDITSCIDYGKKFVITHTTGTKITVDSNLDNAYKLKKQLKKNDIVIENANKKGYVIKARNPIIILLLIFLMIAIVLDILTLVQGHNPGLKGLVFTAIAPIFLFIFCKERYYIQKKTITRKFLFWSKETIDFSSIEKVIIRKDWMEGRHLMVYIEGQDVALFDIDSSYLDTEVFKEDIKRRNKKIIDKY